MGQLYQIQITSLLPHAWLRSHGYTRDLKRAGVFTRKEAVEWQRLYGSEFVLEALR